MNDLNKKSYIDFIDAVSKNNNGSNSSNPINQSERDFFDNKLIKCLEDLCINKKLARPPPPPPPSPPPPPDGFNNNLDENIEQENIQEKNNIRFWVALFNQPKTKGKFYKEFKDLTRDKNVFYKVMDELLSITPVNLNEIFNIYKNESETFNIIMSYLIDRLGSSNDENALKFMVYIKNNNKDLYNEIIKKLPIDIVKKIEKNKKGGKKTRKNRKAKKRFLKISKRNHKKNKTRRGRRKII
jgi:hypothetical protein